MKITIATEHSSDERFGPNLKPEEIASGVGAFVMARAEGRAIGCGALRKLDESTAEVKRMYAEPEQRGRGVAKEILHHLQRVGHEFGVKRLVLEGARLTPAWLRRRGPIRAAGAKYGRAPA